MLLISTYDLGRSPFGLASPAAWLAREGVAVRCLDLGVESLDRDAVRDADLIGFFLPMHTATRLAARVIPEVRALAPRAHLCAYGLYASPNAEYLRSLFPGIHILECAQNLGITGGRNRGLREAVSGGEDHTIAEKPLAARLINPKELATLRQSLLFGESFGPRLHAG